MACVSDCLCFCVCVSPRAHPGLLVVNTIPTTNTITPTMYVCLLQAHWPGSELRLVSGGHVSAFLMHQDAFRAALRDSLARVAAPPRLPSVAAAADGGSTQHTQQQ